MTLNFPVTMSIVDIVTLLILAGFVFYGLFFGLIKTVGSLAGLAVGTLVASRVYLMVFGWIKPLAFGHNDWGITITFILCFTIVNCLVNLLFALLDKTFHLISIIPFLKTINRLGGAIFGFLEGGLVLGLILYVTVRYVPGGGWFFSQLKGSQLVPFLLDYSKMLIPFLPEILRQLKAVI
ncbi:MAG: CvpA family protein [Candidatus Falkowbacteria bacterium]